MQLKQRLDYAKDIIALGRYNELVDVLKGGGGAGELGAVPHGDISAANVQDSLDQLADKRVTYNTLSARYIRVNDDKVLETSPDGEKLAVPRIKAGM